MASPPEPSDPPPTDEGTTEELPVPAEEATSPPPRARRGWRWVRRIAIALVVLAVLIGIAIAVAFEPVARWYVLDQAARRGVRLTPRVTTVRWGHVSFEDVAVELDGVPDLEISVATLAIRADGLVPRDAEAQGVKGRARSADAIRQVLAFGRTHEGDLVPARATDVTLTLGEQGAAVLEARIAEATLPGDGPARAVGVVADVPRPRLVVGPIPLVVSARGALLEVTLGEEPAGAPLKISADLEARRLVVELAPTPAATLATWLGRPASAGPPPWPAHLALRGRGEATWAADPGGDLTGTVDATLLGLVPPHPPELAGIVFGKDTAVSLAFRARATDPAVTLPRLEVAVGSLRLTGTGAIVPRDASFTATAQLRGNIPCAELLGSAAVAHHGLPLGAGLGALARQGLGGTVEVRLGLTVDGDRPMQPDVRPSASIHCRLRLLP